MWVQNEDLNSSFFHNNARIQKHKNQNSYIIDSQGIAHTNRTGIEKTFLDFYSNLWSPCIDLSVDDIYNALSPDLNCISNVDSEFLILLVSVNEIYKTLCSFRLGKAQVLMVLTRSFIAFFGKILVIGWWMLLNISL